MPITVDCMFSVDLMVRDTVKTAALLSERVGLPPLRPTWTDSSVEHVAYLRAYHPFSQASPTLIELITPVQLPASQGQAENRPMRTHATVLVTKMFDQFVERLRAKGILHYVMPDPGDGLKRVFLGIENFAVGTAGNRYEPRADGNLFLEVISWSGTTLSRRAPAPVEVAPGGITRVVARSYLVPDLDITLGALRDLFGWAEAHKNPAENADIRFLSLQPDMATSAALELIQAKNETGRHGDFFAQWGTGPHAIRFGVRDLDAKAHDLHERGTNFSRNTSPAGDQVLLVDEAALDGIVVELIEDPR